MQNLKIGQGVYFHRIASMEYTYPAGKRHVEYHDIVPTAGVIVGQSVKQTGTYHAASNGGWYNDGEYDPAYLTVDAVKIFWEVRTSLRGKPLLVADADIRLCDAPTLPAIARRPLAPEPGMYLASAI